MTVDMFAELPMGSLDSISNSLDLLQVRSYLAFLRE